MPQPRQGGVQQLQPGEDMAQRPGAMEIPVTVACIIMLLAPAIAAQAGVGQQWGAEEEGEAQPHVACSHSLAPELLNQQLCLRALAGAVAAGDVDKAAPLHTISSNRSHSSPTALHGRASGAGPAGGHWCSPVAAYSRAAASESISPGSAKA